MSKITAHDPKPYPMVYLYTPEDENNSTIGNGFHLFGVNTIIVILVIITLSLSIFLVFYFANYYSQTGLIAESPKSKQSNTLSPVESASTIINLPIDEVPEVEIIYDLSKYSSYKSFEKLQELDIAIKYKENDQIYFYRADENKIVGIDSYKPSSQVAGVETKVELKNLKVKILNGSKTSGIGSDFQKLIERENTNVKVQSVESAVKSNYIKNKLVILNEQLKKEAEIIASKYNFEITALPPSEIASAVDVIIIIGELK